MNQLRVYIHMYICISFLLNLPPHPSRSSQSSKLSALCYTELPTSYLFHPCVTYVYVRIGCIYVYKITFYMTILICQFPLLPLLCPQVLSLSVSLFLSYKSLGPFWHNKSVTRSYKSSKFSPPVISSPYSPSTDLLHLGTNPWCSQSFPYDVYHLNNEYSLNMQMKVILFFRRM